MTTQPVLLTTQQPHDRDADGSDTIDVSGDTHSVAGALLITCVTSLGTQDRLTRLYL